MRDSEVSAGNRRGIWTAVEPLCCIGSGKVPSDLKIGSVERFGLGDLRSQFGAVFGEELGEGFGWKRCRFGGQMQRMFRFSSEFCERLLGVYRRETRDLRLKCSGLGF